VEIALEGLGKKFRKDWVFRDLNHQFKNKSSTAIIGNNGSGKSTLLKLISTFSDPTLGKINYSKEQPERLISFAAPYLELIEELTLLEHLKFHFRFKKTTRSLDEMVQTVGLEGSEKKLIADFSSGMKQRLKLVLAFSSTDPLVLLDEPCSNLDESGIEWYQKQLSSIIGEKTIIIASNQRFEYGLCADKLNISSFKSARK
jgi:ABC-type multidrug transport system ATPase subunit